MPSLYFLPSHYQWAITRAFNKVTLAAKFLIQTIKDLCKHFPLDEWKHAIAQGKQLVQFLYQNVDSILAKWLESRKSKKLVSSTSNSSPIAGSASNSKLTANKRRVQVIERQTKINNKTALLVALQQKKLMENHIRLFGSVLESPFLIIVPSLARGVTPSPLNQCSMPSPPPQYDQSPG